MFTQLCGAAGYVEFPKLFGGLKIPIDEIAFTLFGIQIRWYGMLIGGAVILCVLLGLRACRHYDIESNDLLDYLLIAIPSAIVGARAYYVIFNFSQYKDDLKSVFYYWEGGLAIYGGVIAAMIAVFCVAKFKKQPFLKLADFAMPYILLGQAIGRWGNFFNQEAFGGRTELPWGMTGSQISSYTIGQGWPAGTLVHPTFFYESFWCLLGFVLIMLYRRSCLKKARGECVCLYMIWYGFERVFVEGLRTDSLYIGSTNIRISQVLSAVLVVLGILLFLVLRRRYNQREEVEGAEDPGQKTGFEGVAERLNQDESLASVDSQSGEIAGKAIGPEYGAEETEDRDGETL